MADNQFTTDELATEEWRDIIGYEGIYSVSNIGRVRRDKPHGHGGGTHPGKILKPSIKKGYCHVDLYQDRQRKFASIHGLVLAAFVGPCPDGKQVNHIDFVRSNNRLQNLEYLTHQENVQYSLSNYHRGEQRTNHKLTAQDVLTIRAKYTRGQGISLAKEFGVDASHIRKIVKREWWTHV